MIDIFIDSGKIVWTESKSAVFWRSRSMRALFCVEHRSWFIHPRAFGVISPYIEDYRANAAYFS